MPDVDVLLVSLGSTTGLATADRGLAQLLERTGARVAVAVARPQRDVRTLALTDLAWALAARRAAREAISVHQPRSVLYSTATAALLWPRAGAIRFDALAAGNRPGRHGVWQRPLERRRLAQSPLLVPASMAALREASVPGHRALVVPIPIEPSGPPGAARDIAAITYSANPAKKGLDRVLAAWEHARREGEELVVAGLDEQAVGAPRPLPPGVRLVGRLAAGAYRALVRRARVFVIAPRREDYGAAQLEALADGCLLVTTAAPGPYAALQLARELDPRLVGEDLAGALRLALDDPRADYRERAAVLLKPYGEVAVGATVAERLLPALLGRSA